MSYQFLNLNDCQCKYDDRAYSRKVEEDIKDIFPHCGSNKIASMSEIRSLSDYHNYQKLENVYVTGQVIAQIFAFNNLELSHPICEKAIERYVRLHKHRNVAALLKRNLSNMSVVFVRILLCLRKCSFRENKT